MDWSDIHFHCLSCVSSSCSSQRGCPMVQCPHCLASLHDCKLGDHLDNVCPNSLVSCCNRNYGCNMLLKRSTLGVHLEHCPASIVQCCFSYFRLQKIHQQPYGGVRGWCGEIRSECGGIRSECGEIRSECGGIRSECGKERDGESLSILEQQFRSDLKFIESRSNDPSTVSETTCDTSNNTLISVDCSADYNRLAFLRQLPLTDDQSKRYFHLVSRRYDTIFATHWNEFRHMFICSLFVRRKDFADHIKKHDDLCGELSFKTQHCPLYGYGCLFNCTEIVPSGGVLEYHPTLHSFFIKGFSHDETSNCGLLSTLPVEILIYLFSFVDCFGLWSLSQTCKYLQNLCEEYLLPGKAIVYSCWEKDGSKWTNLKQIKTFPRTSSNASSWRPVTAPYMSVSVHLQKGCQAVEPTQWMSYKPDYVVDLLNILPMKFMKKEEMEKNIAQNVNRKFII